MNLILDCRAAAAHHPQGAPAPIREVHGGSARSVHGGPFTNDFSDKHAAPGIAATAPSVPEALTAGLTEDFHPDQRVPRHDG
jgi:hypothetical protein